MRLFVNGDVWQIAGEEGKIFGLHLLYEHSKN